MFNLPEEMPERSNGLGLGPSGSCLRGFESSSPHLFAIEQSEIAML